MAVVYEWDVEEVATVDSEQYAVDDIIEHCHSAKFKEALADKARLEAGAEPGIGYRIVLVRDDDIGRSWAYFYPEDNTLDEWFEDAYPRRVCKVPKRYVEEVAKTLAKATAKAK
jgi:hypothetical protein